MIAGTIIGFCLITIELFKAREGLFKIKVEKMFTLLSSLDAFELRFSKIVNILIKNGADFVFVPTYEEHPQFADSILK